MLKDFRSFAVALGFLAFLAASSLGARVSRAQASGTIEGMVRDPSGGAIAGASVEILNPVSKYGRGTKTDSEGRFRFANVPFNPYHVTVKADGFSDFSQDLEVRSLVTASLNVTMTLAGANTTVTVEGDSDLLEKDSTFHTDVDRGLFEKMPLESASSSVSSLVTLVSPGIAADSNGNMHALGDHAQTAFSLDGQSITDQTSKVFSNQIPADSIQSLEVISGAPPAEFGDKTSLII